MKRSKLFFIHTIFIDYRNPLFELLGKSFDLTMLMTRETIEPDENMFYLKYRKRPDNLRYVIFPHTTFFSKYGFAWRIIPYLLFRDYDVVVGSDTHLFETHVAFFISKLRRKKFVAWTETFDWKRAPRALLIDPFVKLVCKYSDACVAVGFKSREYFLKKGAQENKIFIAPDTALHYEIKKMAIHPELKNKKIILYIGRIVPYKGLDILIKAFSHLEKEREDVFLLVGGKGSFEDEVKKIKAKNVKFLGPIDKEHIGFYYSLCDIFVLPSTFRDYDADCWGLVLNEAMSFGKPVISTDAVGAAYDLIKNGVNGFMVKHGDPDDLYNSLKILVNDDKLRECMGKESKKIIDNRFNYKNMSNGFKEAIDYALSKH